jgi:hypothetical protein
LTLTAKIVSKNNELRKKRKLKINYQVKTCAFKQLRTRHQNESSKKTMKGNGVINSALETAERREPLSHPRGVKETSWSSLPGKAEDPPSPVPCHCA